MFDRNSAYPYAGTQLKMGIAKPIMTENYEYFTKFTKVEKICGFVQCDIYFDKINAILPFTCENKKTKTWELVRSTIPIFDKIITSIEYWYLIEKGVQITFKKAMVFEKFDETYSLSKFFTKMYAIKSNECLGKDINYVAKIVANALSGKFGQKINQQSSEFIMSESNDPHTINDKASDTVEYKKPKQKDEHLFVTEVISDKESLKNFMFVHWICAITAFQRVSMSELIFFKFKGQVLYCDTDSIVLKPNFIMENTNKLLGGWKNEHDFITFRAIGKKLYAYEELKNGKIIRVVKAKGLINEQKLDGAYEKIMDWNEGEKITFAKVTKIISFKQALIRVTGVTFSGYCTGVYEEIKTLSPKAVG
jgi:hypothetical protein